MMSTRRMEGAHVSSSFAGAGSSRSGGNSRTCSNLDRRGSCKSGAPDHVTPVNSGV